jgi:hypothetical protein
VRNHRIAVLATPVLTLLAALVALPLLAVGGDLAAASPPLPVSGIPTRALAAYRQAAELAGCPGLRWELLAGIGWIESGHGSTAGASLNPETGEVTPWIFGPPLDGRAGGRAISIATWSGWWGLTGAWQRAVGPMQFLPATFTAWAVDGDLDGVVNPHDIDDAAVTAAHYLCGPSHRIDDERAAVLRYNHSAAYAERVLAYVEGLALSASASIVCPVAGPTSFIDTWLAPRPGGRQHLGVDMFARAGTPVVAPATGLLESADNSVGGLAFRVWGDDGTYYYGAHLSSHATAIGRVPAGAIVGYVGNTGDARTTAPHLHFEIHPGRARGEPPSPVNPTPAVGLACAQNRIGASFGGAD